MSLITPIPMDSKFIDQLFVDIKKWYTSEWFLTNFTQFKKDNLLKIDLGRIVQSMSMPDDKSDLATSLSMSSEHLINQIQYIIPVLYSELPSMLNAFNWKLTKIQYMFYDPDYINYNKYTGVQTKGKCVCQILVHIEQIEGKSPFCKNPNSPKENVEFVNTTKIDEKLCLKCHNKFTPKQAHYQNCVNCTKFTIATSKKCKTCPTVFTPEQPYYVNCLPCFEKIKSSGAKSTTDTKKCSDCSTTFKPIKSHYHQCMSCFGKKK